MLSSILQSVYKINSKITLICLYTSIKNFIKVKVSKRKKGGMTSSLHANLITHCAMLKTTQKYKKSSFIVYFTRKYTVQLCASSKGLNDAQLYGLRFIPIIILNSDNYSNLQCSF